MAERNKPIDLEYLKYLAEDSLLNAKDIMGIFGYTNIGSVHRLVSRNQFPECDLKSHGFKRDKMISSYWKKSTVMEAIARFNESLAQVEA